MIVTWKVAVGEKKDWMYTWSQQKKKEKGVKYQFKSVHVTLITATATVAMEMRTKRKLWSPEGPSVWWHSLSVFMIFFFPWSASLCIYLWKHKCTAGGKTNLQSCFCVCVWTVYAWGSLRGFSPPVMWFILVPCWAVSALFHRKKSNCQRCDAGSPFCGGDSPGTTKVSMMAAIVWLTEADDLAYRETLSGALILAVIKHFQTAVWGMNDYWKLQ